MYAVKVFGRGSAYNEPGAAQLNDATAENIQQSMSWFVNLFADEMTSNEPLPEYLPDDSVDGMLRSEISAVA